MGRLSPVTVARPRRICTGFPFQPRLGPPSDYFQLLMVSVAVPAILYHQLTPVNDHFKGNCINIVAEIAPGPAANYRLSLRLPKGLISWPGKAISVPLPVWPIRIRALRLRTDWHALSRNCFATGPRRQAFHSGGLPTQVRVGSRRRRPSQLPIDHSDSIKTTPTGCVSCNLLSELDHCSEAPVPSIGPPFARAGRVC